jgi:hypothetical protein
MWCSSRQHTLGWLARLHHMSCWSLSASYPSRGARRLTRDFSTLWRRQKTLGGNIPYRGSDGRFRQLPRTQCRNLTGGNPPLAKATA